MRSLEQIRSDSHVIENPQARPNQELVIRYGGELQRIIQQSHESSNFGEINDSVFEVLDDDLDINLPKVSSNTCNKN